MGSLFDLIDEQIAREQGKPCPHLRESPSYTIWPGETWERLTMTCDACGRYRGRYPGEPYATRTALRRFQPKSA